MAIAKGRILEKNLVHFLTTYSNTLIRKGYITSINAKRIKDTDYWYVEVNEITAATHLYANGREYSVYDNLELEEMLSYFEVEEPTPGLYRVHWKEKGTSLAAIGRCSDGKLWINCTNWVGQFPAVFSAFAEDIERLEKLA